MQEAQKRKRVCRYENVFLQEHFLKFFFTNMNICKPEYTLVQSEKTQQLVLARQVNHVIQTKVFFQRK